MSKFKEILSSILKSNKTKDNKMELEKPTSMTNFSRMGSVGVSPQYMETYLQAIKTIEKFNNIK